MKIRINFIWYDMWIGIFISLPKHTIYFCPLPCVVISFHWKVEPEWKRMTTAWGKTFVPQNSSQIHSVALPPEYLKAGQELMASKAKIQDEETQDPFLL